MKQGDVVLLVDVLADFGHDDGAALFASYRSALGPLTGLIAQARSEGVSVIYANDDFGTWSGDRGAVEREARARSPEPSVFDAILPRPEDAFLCKPRYSAFDHTALPLLLEDRGARRILLAGTATEMCVTQTAIGAREHGYLVSVVVDACSSVSEEDAGIALRYLERVVGVRLCAAGAAGSAEAA
jgi:nicotinamidase-related amidase